MIRGTALRTKSHQTFSKLFFHTPLIIKNSKLKNKKKKIQIYVTEIACRIVVRTRQLHDYTQSLYF